MAKDWKVKHLFVLLILATTAPRLCNGSLSQPRDVAFTAAVDGTTQYYIEMLPTDFDPTKKYDLIIGLHGHGSDRQQFATDKRAETTAFREFAAKYNMLAVTPDYRAKTSWMGPKAEADLVQIITDLKKKYPIHRVFVVGGSMGASSALSFAALHPDLVAGVTALNGQANHLEFSNFQAAIAESFGGSKAQIPLEYKKRSAEYWPELLTMPIAFTTGGKDTLVPPDSSLRLVEILKKLNRNVLLIHRPEGGHSSSLSDSLAAMEFMYDPQKPADVAVRPTPPSTTPPAPAPVANSATQVSDWAAVQPVIQNAAGKAELGLRFSVQKAGKLKAFRFYQAQGESGPHVLRLWDAAGKLRLTVTAPERAAVGWISAPLPEPFTVNPDDNFILSYTCNFNYPGTPGVFKTPIARGGLTGIAGLYSFDNLGTKAPDKNHNNLNYFIDVDFE